MRLGPRQLRLRDTIFETNNSPQFETFSFLLLKETLDAYLGLGPPYLRLDSNHPSLSLWNHSLTSQVTLHSRFGPPYLRLDSNWQPLDLSSSIRKYVSITTSVQSFERDTKKLKQRRKALQLLQKVTLSFASISAVSNILAYFASSLKYAGSLSQIYWPD